ncbi:sigma-70 family RNA polymerase sigma factor [Siccirubricoccus deserti]
MTGQPEQEERASVGQDLAARIESLAQKRDRAAFEALFRHFAPRLKTYFLRSGTAGDAEADEMVQETMLLVWRKAALFDRRKAGATTWIFTIARNIRTDARRRSRSSPALLADCSKEMEWMPDPVSGADDLLASAQQEAGLHEAFATLSLAQRQVLDLAYFGERSHSEIANRLGIRLGP